MPFSLMDKKMHIVWFIQTKLIHWKGMKTFQILNICEIFTVTQNGWVPLPDKMLSSPSSWYKLGIHVTARTPAPISPPLFVPDSMQCKCKSVGWSRVCLPACLSDWLSVCLAACLSVCLSIWLTVCLPACPSVYLSSCLSVSLPAYLADCLSAWDCAVLLLLSCLRNWKRFNCITVHMRQCLDYVST